MRSQNVLCDVLLTSEILSMDKEEGIRMVGIRRGVFSKDMWFFWYHCQWGFLSRLQVSPLQVVMLVLQTAIL